MKYIRLHICAFALISALGTAACVLVIIFGAVSSEPPTYLLLAALLLMAGASAALWIREYGRLRLARLITGNAIMYIRTAVIRDLSDGTEKVRHTDSEVFVSYFGILLDSRLIKFNQDGIRLRDVEFGLDYISLTYGTEHRIQNTRLLRPAISREELGAVAERFRFETGIVPNICS